MCKRTGFLRALVLLASSIYVTFFLKISQVQGQSIANGCLAGSVTDNTKGFGVNAFLYTGTGNSFSTGTVNPPKGTIDWFKPAGGLASHRNIIDQTNPSAIVSILNGANNNPTFVRRQNGELNSKADIVSPTKYSFLVDAVWSRDNFGGSGAIDTTSFAVSSKNGQDPLLWGPVNRQSIDLSQSNGRKFGPGIPTNTLIPDVKVFIADAMTPNRDGINDTWIIVRPATVKVGVKVFNRWGQIVFRSDDYQNNWNGVGVGNFLGKELPHGSYFYIVEITNRTNGAKDIRKGSLLLSRDY